MADEREAQDVDAEAAEDLELGEEAEGVSGGRPVSPSDPDAGLQRA
jgi:hypothetical protein